MENLVSIKKINLNGDYGTKRRTFPKGTIFAVTCNNEYCTYVVPLPELNVAMDPDFPDMPAHHIGRQWILPNSDYDKIV